MGLSGISGVFPAFCRVWRINTAPATEFGRQNRAFRPLAGKNSQSSGRRRCDHHTEPATICAVTDHPDRAQQVTTLCAPLRPQIAAGSVVWPKQVQCERENELLLIGHAFRTAIGRYYELSPGAIKRYPRTLDDLLRDDRFITQQRHLRKIYRDPLTGKTEWGLVAAPIGGIMGVYGQSDEMPTKQSRFDTDDAAFEGAQRYRDWKFIYTSPAALGPPVAPSGN